MNLDLAKKLFLVGGATSGFGSAIARALLEEGSLVIAVARSEEKLAQLKAAYPQGVETICADITAPGAVATIMQAIGSRQLHGAVINAGGPPAKTTLETTLADWDAAYQNILRWKVALSQALLPAMMQHRYGRLVFIESASVKQHLENLVLSNSLRLAVVGLVKTLSQEIARSGVTLNVMAPGSHDTPAIERIYNKKAEQTGLDPAAVRANAIQQIPVGFLGAAEDFAGLALWLLSPQSKYVTGQVYSLDGGSVKSTF